MYVGHTYKKSKNMTCNIQKKYKKNIKMKNLVHVVNLSLDYWTLNGMPTINNEIFFLSLYQVYYYYLYLVKLLPSTQTTCTHTLSLNFLIFTTNTLTKQENIFIKFSNYTYLYILTQRKPLRFIDCQQQLRFQHFTA